MHRPSLNRGRGRGSGSGRWRRPARRAVSDVVATILLLALTVTLFASIFAFVGAFPQPTPQAQNEFQSSLVLASNGTYVTGITITHLAGPVLPTSDHILLSSSRVQTGWQFNIGGSGIPVGWGLGNSSTGWALGQVWSTSFTKLVKVPDNITVYVVTSTQLLYSATLPALTQNIPPAVQEVGTSPSSLTIGEAFQVWATLSGNSTGVTVTVNLNGIPGLSGVKSMVNDSYVWVYNVTAATTTAGTYYAFITVTAASGQTVSQSVPVVVSTSGGGGGSSSTLTVAVGVSPQPLTVPSYTIYPYAVISYTGSSSSVPVYVNFTIVQSVGGKKALTIVKTTDNGPTGNTINGPNSTTIYALNSVSSWYLNGSVVIYANASLPGVGKAYGTLSIPAYNLVQGIVYFTTSGTAPAPQGALTTSHSCTSSTCPFLFLTVWNNFTASPYGGGNVYVAGSVYTNSTTGGYSHTYTIASTQISVGGSLNINAVTAGSTTARWSSPGGNRNTVYYAYLWLTVSLTSGGPAIGYIYDVSPSLTFTS